MFFYQSKETKDVHATAIVHIRRQDVCDISKVIVEVITFNRENVEFGKLTI